MPGTPPAAAAVAALVWKRADAGFKAAQTAWAALDAGVEDAPETHNAWWIFASLLKRNEVAHGAFNHLGDGAAGLTGKKEEWMMDALIIKEQLSFLKLPADVNQALVAHKGKPMAFVSSADGWRSKIAAMLVSLGSGDVTGAGGPGFRPMTADQVLGKAPGAIQIHAALQSSFYTELMARLNGTTPTKDTEWAEALCASTFSVEQRTTMLALLRHKERAESSKEKDEAKAGSDAAKWTAFLDLIKVKLMTITRDLLESRVADSDEAEPTEISTAVVAAVVTLCLQLPDDDPAVGEKDRDTKQAYSKSYMGIIMSQLYLFSPVEDHHAWRKSPSNMRVSDMHYAMMTFAKVMRLIWGPKIGKDGPANLVAWSRVYDRASEGGCTWPGGLQGIIAAIPAITVNEWAKGLREELHRGSKKRVESWGVLLEREHLAKTKKTRCAQYERAIEHLGALKAADIVLKTPEQLGVSMSSPFVSLTRTPKQKGKGFQGLCDFCNVQGHRKKDCPDRPRQQPSPKKGKICFQFQSGNCKRGDDCKFRHDDDGGGGGSGLTGGAKRTATGRGGAPKKTGCSDCGDDDHKKGDRNCAHMQAYWDGMKALHLAISASGKPLACLFQSLKQCKCSATGTTCQDKSRRDVSHESKDQLTPKEAVKMLTLTDGVPELFEESPVKHRFLALLDPNIRREVEEKLKIGTKKTRR